MDKLYNLIRKFKMFAFRSRIVISISFAEQVKARIKDVSY